MIKHSCIKIGSLITVIILSSGCSTFSTSIDQQLQQLDVEYRQSPSQARSQLQTLKNDHLNDARPWIKSGFWSLQENNIERARIAFIQARRLDNDNPDVYMGLGLCADEQKNHPQAQEYYQQGIELDNTHLKLKNNLAVSYLLSKEVTKAIALLELITRELPANTRLSQTEKDRLQANLSLAYSMNRQLEEAYKIDKELLGEPAAQRNRLAKDALFQDNQP